MIRSWIKICWLKIHENSGRGTLSRLLLFLFLYFIGRYIFIFFENTAPFTDNISIIHKHFLWIIDHCSYTFWSIFYSDIVHNPDHLFSINGIDVIILSGGCSGVHPMLRMTFILLLYPISWGNKLWLFPISGLIIIFAATIHFILLIPIAYHWPEYYLFSHTWLTKIVFYGFYFLTWLLWERIGYPKKK